MDIIKKLSHARLRLQAAHLQSDPEEIDYWEKALVQYEAGGQIH